MPRTRNSICGFLVAMVVLSCASCAGDANPQVAETGTTPLAPPDSTSPTPTGPATPGAIWRDAFTPEQLEAYEQAVARLSEYEQRSEPIWAQGKVTPAAVDLFKQYFPSPAWQLVRDRLATYEQVRVKVVGTPAVLASRATKVIVNPGGESVTALQCIDVAAVRTTQYGAAVARDEIFDQPIERVVQLRRSGDGPWLIYDNPEATRETARVCDPEVVA